MVPIWSRVSMNSGGVALFSWGLARLSRPRAVYGPTARLPAYPPNRPILVCLFQRGAVDGLNMIVPHGDALYYRERPRIAGPATDVLDLDGYFGLHPLLAPLKPRGDAKSLAAIHAIGSPDASPCPLDPQRAID